MSISRQIKKRNPTAKSLADQIDKGAQELLNAASETGLLLPAALPIGLFRLRTMAIELKKLIEEESR